MKRLFQFVVIIIVLFVFYVWVMQPNMFAAVMSDIMGSPAPTDTTTLPTIDEIVPTIEEKIALPTVELPPMTVEGNTIRLTEADINASLGDFGTDQVQISQVRLVPNQIILVLNVAGLSTELSANLAAENGQVVVQNSALSGVAGALIPVEELVGPLQTAINQVIAENAPVKAIRIDNGVVEVELNR